MVGANLTKVHCVHIWKYHNEIRSPPIELINENKNIFKNSPQMIGHNPI
jgi:hypothetical protein